MGCSYKWTFLCSIIILSSESVVFGQSGGQRNQHECTSKDLSNVSSKAQLVNALLSMAAANGALPDLLPVIQPSISKELTRQPLKDVPQSLNLIQLSNNPYERPQEHIVLTGKPAISVSQPILGSPVTVVPSQQTYIPSQYSYGPALIQTPASPMPHGTRQDAQNTYSNAGFIQPIPAIWQTQPVVAELPRETPTITQISSPKSVIQENSDSSSVEDNKHDPSPNEIPSSVFENLSSPLNLLINIPAQNLPAPKITVVSTAPANAPTVPTPDRNQGSYAYPPFYPPPIILENSDSLNSWLPMILIALMAHDRGNCGACCPCCCPCNSESTIPIPYPIPIPVNSPIISHSGSSNAKLRPSTAQKPSYNDEDDEHADEHHQKRR